MQQREVSKNKCKHFLTLQLWHLTLSHCNTVTLSHWHTLTFSLTNTCTQSYAHIPSLSCHLTLSFLHCHTLTLSHHHTLTPGLCCDMSLLVRVELWTEFGVQEFKLCKGRAYTARLCSKTDLKQTNEMPFYRLKKMFFPHVIDKSKMLASFNLAQQVVMLVKYK